MGPIYLSAHAGCSGILFCGDHLRPRPERRVGLTVVVCSARRVRWWPLPTPDLWEGPGAYVPGGVDVPAQAETATPAPIDSGSERHRLAMPASGAICAGMGRAHLHIRDTSFLGFVSQYEVEGTPPLFRHLLGVSTGAEQSRDVEVLDGDAVQGSNEVVGQAEVGRPGSLGFPAPDPGHSGPLLDPGPRSPLCSRQATLAPADNLVVDGPRRHVPPVGQCHPRCEALVYPHRVQRSGYHSGIRVVSDHHMQLHPQRGTHHPQLHHLATRHSGGQPSVAITEPRRGDSLNPQTPPSTPGTRGHEHRCPRSHYLDASPPVSGLEAGVSGLGPFLAAALVEGLDRTVETTDHAPAHPGVHRRPAGILVPDQGEHLEQVVAGQVPIRGELPSFRVVFPPPRVGALPRLEEGVVHLAGDGQYLIQAAVLGRGALRREPQRRHPRGHSLIIVGGCDTSRQCGHSSI